MILLLDTSGPICKITLVIDEDWYESEWQADRELARGLLGYIETELKSANKDFSDITALGVMRGPGSFTGLRIGITVLNTLADTLSLPIIGETGDNWQMAAVTRINGGENDMIVLPFYGNDAHITKPRK